MDSRLVAARDRDRILYSSAFRRLGGVSQVVSADEGEVYHNRLTHSLKVGQVARRLAERLQAGAADGLPRPNPEAVEAAALAHDLGHPPFGHVGEEVLNHLAAEDGAEGFEGNAQSFRILTKLSVHSSKYAGLNLSRLVLDGVLKYPWLHDPDSPKASRKWGAYASEETDFRFARSLDPTHHIPGPDGALRSVEAQVMDLADDITYAVHDIEDFVRAGLVPLHRLRDPDDGQERQDLVTWIRDKWVRNGRPHPGATEQQINDVFDATLIYYGSDRPYDGSRLARAALRYFTSTLVGKYVETAQLEEDGLLSEPPETTFELDVLKELTWRYVIDRPGLGSQQAGQRRVVATLYKELRDAVMDDKRRSLLPMGAREEAEELLGQQQITLASAARIACDAVSRLTERDALLLHGRVTGMNLGSVLDFA